MIRDYVRTGPKGELIIYCGDIGRVTATPAKMIDTRVRVSILAAWQTPTGTDLSNWTSP